MLSLLLAPPPQASLQAPVPHRIPPGVQVTNILWRRSRSRVSQTIFFVSEAFSGSAQGEHEEWQLPWKRVEVRTRKWGWWQRNTSPLSWWKVAGDAVAGQPSAAQGANAVWLQSSVQPLFPTTAKLQLFTSRASMRLKAQRCKLIHSGKAYIVLSAWRLALSGDKALLPQTLRGILQKLTCLGSFLSDMLESFCWQGQANYYIFHT